MDFITLPVIQQILFFPLFKRTSNWYFRILERKTSQVLILKGVFDDLALTVINFFLLLCSLYLP